MLSKITSDVFLKRYAIYFSGSMVVAILNYVFHPLLGRFLSPTDFGEVQAMLSLVTQFGIIFGAFSVVAINITANSENRQERNALLFELQKIALWTVTVFAICLVFFINTLQAFFQFSSVYVLLALVSMLPISAIATFRNAYLQGISDFTTLTSAQVVSALSRLILAIGFVFVGFGMFGAVVGIVVSNALSLLFLLYRTYKQVPLKLQSSLHILEKGSILKELHYGVLVFFATALVTVYYTSDVLIVKRFFSPEEAGLYSGISAIAKILFFVIAPVAAVLVSAVKIKNTFKENQVTLFKTLTITLLIGGAGLCTFSLFHDIVVKLMLGSTYVQFSHHLPKASIVMFLAAIVNILVLYFLALRRFVLVAMSVVSIFGLVLVLVSEHSTIDAILNNLIYSLTTIIIFLVLLYGKDYLNHRSGV